MIICKHFAAHAIARKELKLSKLLINEPPLLVFKTLAVKIGLNEAIVLQQLHFLCSISNNEKDGHAWVYNTIDSWRDNHFEFWSRETIKRVFLSLREKNLVHSSSDFNKMKIDKTLWYRVNYDELKLLENDAVTFPLGQNDPSSGSNCANGLVQNDPSNNHKITHKNTTDIHNTSSTDDAAPVIKPVRKKKTAPVNEIINAYNEVLGDVLPKAIKPSAKRTKMITDRWYDMLNSQHPDKDILRYTDTESGIAWWKAFFSKVKLRPHWLGDNESGWAANLDWIIKEDNFIKVLEFRPVSKK